MASADKPRVRHGWLAGAVVLVLALGIVLGWHFVVAPREIAKAADKGSTPELVTVAEAKSGTFPVYLNGLGTVQPYETVTVHSRVDGQIVGVYFRQGQTVAAGDVLAKIDPRPYQAALDQAKAKKSEDEADAGAGPCGPPALPNPCKEPVRAEAAGGDPAGDGRSTRRRDRRRPGAIDSASTQLDYTTIHAPIAGRTGFRGIDTGNIIHAADTAGIVTIVQAAADLRRVHGAEEQIQAINQALALGEVRVTALSSDGAQVLSQGRLALVNNAVDETSGTIGMKASFANGDNALWPGLSVSTRLLLRTLKDVVVVPEDALQRGPDGFYVFVVGDDNKVKQQAVKVGDQDGGKAVIAQGLSDGQKVVTEGTIQAAAGNAGEAAERQCRW